MTAVKCMNVDFKTHPSQEHVQHARSLPFSQGLWPPQRTPPRAALRLCVGACLLLLYVRTR